MRGQKAVRQEPFPRTWHRSRIIDLANCRSSRDRLRCDAGRYIALYGVRSGTIRAFWVSPRQFILSRPDTRGNLFVSRLPHKRPRNSMIPIRDLFESHLTVSDLKSSMAFFGHTLGLELAE